MKKQLKKLNLSKNTISNLNADEMLMKKGGGKTQNGRKCQSLLTLCFCSGRTC